MSGLNRDRRGLAAATVCNFQVVSPNQAVVLSGVAEAFESESGVCHAVLRIQSVNGSCLRLAKDWVIRCVAAEGYYGGSRGVTGDSYRRKKAQLDWATLETALLVVRAFR